MRRALSILTALALLPSCNLQPPHVLLAVSDGTGLAADTTAVAVGTSLDDLRSSRLETPGLPTTVSVTHPDDGAEVDLWVEGQDAAGVLLGRALVRAQFSSTRTETVPVELLGVCEHDEHIALDCARPDPADGVGTCRAGVCALPVDATLSMVESQPAVPIAADGVAVATITVRVVDTAGDPVPNMEVALAFTGSNNIVTFEQPLTDAEGTVTATLATTFAEAKVVTATVTTPRGTFAIPDPAIVEFSAGAPSPANSSVTAIPNVDVLADGSEASTITVTVRDADNNPVPGVSVQLTANPSHGALVQPAAATDLSGLASGALTCDQPGDVEVGAILDPGGADVVLPQPARVLFVSRAPAVRAVRMPLPPYGGCVPIEYDLWQARAEPVDVLVEVLLPSGWARATQAGSDPDETGVIGTPSSAGLLGRANTFLWASDRDLPDSADDVTVMRMTPRLDDHIGAAYAFAVSPQNDLNLTPTEASLVAPPTLTEVHATASADFNGDANADVALGGGQWLEVRFGEGDGTFTADETVLDMQPLVSRSLATNVDDLMVTDHNRDGIPDLLALVTYVGWDDLNLIVNYGAGDGSFPTHTIDTILTTGARNSSATGQLSLGDLDADGWPDLAITHCADDTVFLMYGRSDGAWDQASISPIACPSDVAIGDLNEDGHADIAIFTHWEAQVRIFRGDSARTFIDSGIALDATGGSTQHRLALVDLNRDGARDIVALNSGTLTVFPSYVGIGYSVPTSVNLGFGGLHNMGFPDLNLDGWPEIVLIGQTTTAAFSIFVQIPEQAASGHIEFEEPFGVGVTLDGTYINGVAADIDSDGRNDLVVTAPGGTRTLLNELPRSCSTSLHGDTALVTGPTPVDVAALDINGDGKTDLVSINNGDDTATVALGRGDGSFVPGPTVDLCAGATACLGATVATAGDVNGDRRDDLVVGLVDSSTIRILWTHAGALVPGPELPTGSSPADLLVADFDRDGNNDIAVLEQGDGVSAGSLALLLGDGTGGLAAGPVLPTGVLPIAATAGHLDDDELLDVVVANSGSNDIAVFRGDVAGTLTSASFLSLTGTEPVAVALANLSSADHLTGILVANRGSTDLEYFANDDVSGLALDSVLATADGTAPRALMTVLRRSDGLDVVAATLEPPHGVAVYFADIDTGDVEHQDLDILAGASRMTRADFDGDGVIDLAFTQPSFNRLTADLGIWTFQGILTDLIPRLMRGTAVEVVAHASAAVATADPNHDGLSEIVLAHPDADAFTILINGREPACPADEENGFVAHTFTTGDQPVDLAVADLDDNLTADVVTVSRGDDALNIHYSADVLAWTATSFASPPVTISMPIGTEASAVVAVDIDRDDNLDLVVASPSTDALLAYLGQAGGGFAARPPVLLPAGSAPVDLAVANLNGDGFADILYTDAGLPGFGLITAGPASESTTTTGPPARLAVADINQDSVLDVLAAVPSTNIVEIAYGQITSGIWQSATTQILTAASPIDVVANDIDADGLPEVLVLETDPPALAVLLNRGWDGSATDLSDIRRYVAPTGAAGIASAHFSGTARRGAVVFSSTDTQVAILLEDETANEDIVCDGCAVAHPGLGTWLVALVGLVARRRRPA